MLSVPVCNTLVTASSKRGGWNNSRAYKPIMAKLLACLSLGLRCSSRPSRYGASQCSVDRPTDHQSISAGYNAGVRAAGLRCPVWKPVPEACQEPGCRGGAHRATQPLGECFCGTRDRQRPAGMPGPCHRVEPASLETNSSRLFEVLSSLAYRPVTGDG